MVRLCGTVRQVLFVVNFDCVVLAQVFTRLHIRCKVIKNGVADPTVDTVLITSVQFPWKKRITQVFSFKVKRLLKGQRQQ